MCIVDSEKSVDSITREFGLPNLPIVLIQNGRDLRYISDGIERLHNSQFREQLIQRMSELNIQSGTKELCKYLCSLHESNQV